MLVFLFNQTLGDRHETGGNVLCSQIIVRSKGAVIAPLSLKNTFHNLNKDLIFFSSDNDLEQAKKKYRGPFTFRFYVLIIYIRRAFKTYFLLKQINNLEKVYLTGDFISNSLPAWLIKRKRKDVIILSNFFHRNPTPHERQGTSFFISFFSRLLQTVSLKLMKSMSDRVFVLSEVGKNELLKEGFDSAKIVISGAGMEKSIISKYTNIPKIDNQLIFLGRLDKTKGIFDLIHILDKLNKLNENFVCKIVGSGHDQTIQQLNNLANQFGINNKIEFLGYVSEQVKYELLASSQTLLLPSKEEGYSIVIQEALYLSTEVVCYELPALKVLFGAYDTVHFVSLNDVANFAREINNVIIRKNIKKVEDNFSSWDDVFSIQSKYF